MDEAANPDAVQIELSSEEVHQHEHEHDHHHVSISDILYLLRSTMLD
jgi:hypothetical protein